MTLSVPFVGILSLTLVEVTEVDVEEDELVDPVDPVDPVLLEDDTVLVLPPSTFCRMFVIFDKSVELRPPLETTLEVASNFPK